LEIKEWYKKNNLGEEEINLIEYLRRNKPYTDKEIMEAIEKVHEIGGRCGLSIKDAVHAVAINEIATLKQKIDEPYED